MGYVKLRSWHLIRTWTRVPGHGMTLCGRRFTDVHSLADTFGDEKSCETCLRLEAKA